MTRPEGEVTGYLHPEYARSFEKLGATRELPACGGWVVERSIPGSTCLDAMGCYPLFACRDWSGLPRDLATLRDRLVSLTIVTDPFGDFAEDDLRRTFELVRPYKDHFVVDLEVEAERPLPRRHRRNLARGLERLRLEMCEDPTAQLDDWVRLYSQLIARHRITDIRRFSRDAFERQLGVPGLVMFRASADGALAGLHLWYVQGDVAYGHLGATSSLGYELAASYALYAYAIDRLRERVRWLDLGGAAGVKDVAGHGLRDFKQGWSTGTRPVFLCGEVLQPERYAGLVEARGIIDAGYFPAYRHDEFAAADAVGDARPGRPEA